MIYTDALQTFIMVVGAVILTVKGEAVGCRDQPTCSPPTLSGPRDQPWGWGWAHEFEP